MALGIRGLSYFNGDFVSSNICLDSMGTLFRLIYVLFSHYAAIKRSKSSSHALVKFLIYHPNVDDEIFG